MQECNMINITFNHKYCNKLDDDGEVIYPCNGSYIYPRTIQEMPQPEAPYLNFCQMMNNGYRQGVDNLDYNFWNGCIYEDIDYKKYMTENPYAIDPETVYSHVCDFLMKNFSEILYYSELSRSRKGFHFIFFFKVPKTESNWKVCKSISTFSIRYAFIACGYKTEIEWPGVWDDCANTIYQACFIAKNNPRFYEGCTGDCRRIIKEYNSDIEDIYNSLWSNKTKHNNEPKKEYNRDAWIITYTRDDIINKVGYLNHHQRFYLFSSLSGLCGQDQEALDREWKYCADHIQEDNGHTISFYEKAPYRNDWNDKRTGKEHIDTTLLKKFGYNISFIAKHKTKSKSDFANNFKFI